MPRQKPAAADRHKTPATSLRLPGDLKAALESLAKDRCSTLTAQLIRGAVEMLTREGRWPAPAGK